MMSRVMSHIAASLLLGLIAFYRLAIGPWLPRRCRFEPSCSAYAREAIERHGPFRGAGFAVARVARCHPWHAGGYDPVPTAGAHGDTTHPEHAARRSA